MKNRLLVREWVVIGILIGAVGLLGVVTHLSKIRIKQVFAVQKACYIQEELIQVAIDGEVERPGVYAIPKESVAKDLFKLAKLTKEADRKRMDMHKVLYNGQCIAVPKKELRSKRTAKKKAGERSK